MTPEEEWEQLRIRREGESARNTFEARVGPGFETVIAFTMLIDPMGLLVVCERMRTNYGPWARVNATVFQEEKGHAAFWERWGMDFIESEGGHEKVQSVINDMFPMTLGNLGLPAKDDPLYERDKGLGIRSTDPDEYWEILVDMLRPTFKALGFEMPAAEPQ